MAAIALMALSSCTDKESTEKALLHAGYKPVKIGGYGWFQGSKEDFYKTNFTAVSQNGDTITGCVTKGIFFKGNTIRIND